MHPFLKQYNEVTVPKLKEQFSFDSIYHIPKVSKVVINVGTGSTQTSGKSVDDIAKAIMLISGQKPAVTKSTKAISGFKIRKGMDVGMKVTLRGTRMHDFLIKFIEIALPRTRDFRGLKASGITADGCLHIGIKDSMIFPEVSQDGVGQSIQVSIVTNARNQEEARAFFELLGFVFQTN